MLGSWLCDRLLLTSSYSNYMGSWLCDRLLLTSSYSNYMGSWLCDRLLLTSSYSNYMGSWLCDRLLLTCTSSYSNYTYLLLLQLHLPPLTPTTLTSSYSNYIYMYILPFPSVICPCESPSHGRSLVHRRWKHGQHSFLVHACTCTCIS